MLLNLSRKTSSGIAEMLPLRFEMVFGLFQNLKKILKEEAEEQERQEKQQQKDAGINNVSPGGMQGYANSYMNRSMGNMPRASMPSGMGSMPSMPSMPHL